MPRETITASKWDNDLFAETSVIMCRRKSDAEVAEGFRFTGTLGNYHAIDQWSGDQEIWWDPEAKSLTVGGVILAVSDYLMLIQGAHVRVSAADFSEQFSLIG